MKLVDVHIHLDFNTYEKDIDNLIKECIDKGVKVIIANGVNKQSNRKVLELSKKYDVVKPALGLYPTDVHDLSYEEIDEEIEFIKNSNCIAYGEVGLDNKELDKGLEEEQKQKQLYTFKKFIELSKKTKIPLIIHSRKAEQQIIELLEESKLKNPILHCFMGKKKLMMRAADNGYFFSVLPIVNKSQQLQDLVRYVKLKQLLTETDGPYMSPFDGYSKPHYVSVAIQEIAKIKEIDELEASNMIFMNYLSLFKNK
ncbi:MAG: TatD family hydrolase [Candidatus Woesearchaeota archaeon]